jgi:hypothetical protein
VKSEKSEKNFVANPDHAGKIHNIEHTNTANRTDADMAQEFLNSLQIGLTTLARRKGMSWIQARFVEFARTRGVVAFADLDRLWKAVRAN